jgi:hypothetical protein
MPSDLPSSAAEPTKLPEPPLEHEAALPATDLPAEHADASPAAADAASPAPAEPASLNDAGLDLLFRTARTHDKWSDRPVSDETLCQLFDLLKFGPTSANSSPARFLFIRSQWSKERLKPALSAGNVDKTMAAPVTVIVAYDPHFYDHLPRLFPHTDAKTWFAATARCKAPT